MSNQKSRISSIWNPFVVVVDGESIEAALQRHHYLFGRNKSYVVVRASASRIRRPAQTAAVAA